MGKSTEKDLNWEVIHWAQSALCEPKTVCFKRACFVESNVRDTREGSFCLDCWLRMHRCRECGKVAAQKSQDRKGYECRDCYVPSDDEADLRARADEILWDNTTWTDVVRDTTKRKEGN